MLSSYSLLPIAGMDHVSFLQMLPTQQIFREPINTSQLAANAVVTGRVHVQTRDHLGQNNHLLNSDILYNQLAIHVSSHVSHL